MALNQPLKLCKHARSFGLTLHTPFSSHDPRIILMIPHLDQRLYLPWDGPSESIKQKRIGGSLGSDSNASSQEPSPPLSKSGLGQLCHISTLLPVLWPRGGAEDPLISEKQD